jgi:AcrR family transcriptional regulator
MAPQTRERLITAGTDLLDHGGAEAVTLREVGHRAGVSHNAPYKHFASKEALLAAIAAEELGHQAAVLADALSGLDAPDVALRAAMHHYVAWALEYPARFKLIFGAWTVDSAELGEAADHAHRLLTGIVVAAQEAGSLPPGDPVRLASLLRALAHGAADLAAAGHLASQGKGHAGPGDLVDDLLGYLRSAAEG